MAAANGTASEVQKLTPMKEIGSKVKNKAEDASNGYQETFIKVSIEMMSERGTARCIGPMAANTRVNG